MSGARESAGEFDPTEAHQGMKEAHAAKRAEDAKHTSVKQQKMQQHSGVSVEATGETVSQRGTHPTSMSRSEERAINKQANEPHRSHAHGSKADEQRNVSTEIAHQQAEFSEENEHPAVDEYKHEPSDEKQAEPTAEEQAHSTPELAV